jgi:hypothetical protein
MELHFETARCVHVTNIQGDSEERSVFFGGDNIGLCEKEVLMNLCLILSYRGRAV